MSVPGAAAALRRMLAERFPEAGRTRAGGLPTGVRALDDALDGGLPAGRLTELVSAAPGAGGQFVLAQVLASARALRARAALVDAGEGFDPQALEGQCLRHLVWVRCRPRRSCSDGESAPEGAAAEPIGPFGTGRPAPPACGPDRVCAAARGRDRSPSGTRSALLLALQAAEILVRDGNFAVVAVDLRGVPEEAWRRLPPTAWYRLQRAAEPGEAAVLVQTDEGRVPAAAYRMILDKSLGIAAMGEARRELAARIEPALVRAAARRLAKTG